MADAGKSRKENAQPENKGKEEKQKPKIGSGWLWVLPAPVSEEESWDNGRDPDDNPYERDD